MEDGFEWIENAIIGTRRSCERDWPSDLEGTIKRKSSQVLSHWSEHMANKRLSILVDRKDKGEGNKQHIDSFISIYSSCGGVVFMLPALKYSNVLERLTQKINHINRTQEHS